MSYCLDAEVAADAMISEDNSQNVSPSSSHRFSSPVNEEINNNLRPLITSASLKSNNISMCDLSEECYLFKQDDLCSLSLPILNELRLSNKLLDVTIEVADERIQAHKVILASTIPYFHAMFVHDTVESTMSHITIRDDTLDGEAFRLLIDFVYSGSIRITNCNIQSVLIASSFLGLNKVKDACAEFLKARLQSNNVIGFKTFGEIHTCTSLVQCANVYIEKYFEHVAKTEEFFSLSCDSVIDIISSDDLNVKSEATVFEAVIRWIDRDREERKHHLPQLLKSVRLPRLSPQYLADVVAQEDLIKESLPCRDLLDEARNYHLMPERRSLFKSPRFRARTANTNGVIYAVGGLTRTGDSVSTVEVYNPATGVWKMSQNMSHLRSRVGVAVMNSKLYAIGGYNGHERLSTVEVFDPESNEWTKVASMKYKRSAVGACSLDDSTLYVCGGYDGMSSLDIVESYDANKNEWKIVKSMFKSRSAAGVVSFQGCVVALGGHDGLSIFDSVECYNPDTNEWKLMPSMLTRRCRLGVATLNKKLYVCGGYDGSTFLQTAEVYDPQEQKWSFIARMNCMRSRVALVANCGKLYAIGGYDGAANLKTVEMYDPTEDTWTFVTPMAAHEGGVGVGVIPVF